MFDSFLNIPVYISLTSIFQNQDILLQTLQYLRNQTIIPDKIFLYLSTAPYLLDDGFKEKKITNSKLYNLINNDPIYEVIWVRNTGPYRKLLPILKSKWHEDCIIITVDDDTMYDVNLIEMLLKDYTQHRCVIGYRGVLSSNIIDFKPINKRNNEKKGLYNFLTGKGGILYKPDFFHKTNGLIFDQEIYLNSCKTADDIWFYLVRILNKIDCYVDEKKWLHKDLTKKGLFDHFNRKDNFKWIKNTTDKLIDSGYTF
jgi:hypothetical protein